jgi:hypothetical protein
LHKVPITQNKQTIQMTSLQNRFVLSLSIFLFLFFCSCKKRQPFVDTPLTIIPSLPPVISLKDSLLNWQLINTGIDEDLLDVDFISHSTGFVATKKGIYRSQDTGINWIKIPDTDSGVSEISFMRNFGFAVGKKTLFVSNDYGLNWEKKDLPVLGNEEAVTDCDFGTSKVGYYGTNKGLYRTTDGGSNWKKIDTNYCRVLDATDEMIIDFVTYPNYTFIRSQDSGSTWLQSVVIRNTNNFSTKCVLQNSHFSCAEGLYFRGGDANWYAIFYQQFSVVSSDFTPSLLYQKADNSIYFRYNALFTNTQWYLSCLMRTEKINALFDSDFSNSVWAACTKGKLLRLKKF